VQDIVVFWQGKKLSNGAAHIKMGLCASTERAIAMVSDFWQAKNEQKMKERS
jgi:hypothetical protein